MMLIDPASNMSIGRHFCQQGFVLVPRVFSPIDIATLREASIAHLSANVPPLKEQFANDAHFREPFRSIIFRNELLIGALRELLGDDFLFINEFALHDSYFSGWHTDTSSPEGKAGHEFHWSPRYMMINAAIYLQPGSLDVIPKSYVQDDPLARSIKEAAPLSERYDGAYSVPSAPGDVVLFHLRTSHRATPAAGGAPRKLALFMVAGPNNELTQRYRTWIDQYDVMNKTSRPSVPDEFKGFLEALGLRVM